MRNRFLLAVLALLAAPGRARALTPAAESYLDQGLTALYSLDYDEARARFRQLITQEPKNPYGYLFEAGAIWWQSSNEFGLFKDTPTLEGVFEQDIEDVLRTADAQFDDKDKQLRAEARFAAGMALGTRGQWNLMRGRWLKAYFDGKKAIKHLRKCVKLDPDFYDAYLGLGVYDYQAARLPGVLKLSFLVGLHGDEEGGLREMRLALEKGRFGSRQAAQFLISIYILDRHDYASALPLLQKLRASFPASPYFRFLEVAALYRLNNFDGSHKAALELLEQAKADPLLLGRKELSLFCGLSGSDCFNRKDVSDGIEWFSRAIDSTAPEDAEFLTLAHLYRGIAHDLLGQRSLALDDYERVQGLQDFMGAQAQARRCMVRACTRAEIVGQLKMMTLAAQPAARSPAESEKSSSGH